MGRRAIAGGAGGKDRTGGGSAGGAVITIDVAHPPMSSDEAEQALDELLRTLAPGGRTRIVRVIHGYGSGGKGGTLRTAVRNWAFRRRGKFVLILPGEEYAPFLPAVLGHLARAGGATLSDLAGTTEGMTLLFLP